MLGYVYKISNADESIVYIGSTSKSLEIRWRGHKTDFKRWINGANKACSIYYHFREHGIENFNIYLISEHEVDDRRQLCEFEQLIIDQTNCVNSHAAFKSPEQRAEENRARALQYRANQSANNPKVVLTAEEKQERRRQYQREYAQANKEKLKARLTDYFEANKERIIQRQAERIVCDCGTDIARGKRARHIQTSKHQRLMEQQS